jgi:hypothetical protein
MAHHHDGGSEFGRERRELLERPSDVLITVRVDVGAQVRHEWIDHDELRAIVPSCAGHEVELARQHDVVLEPKQVDASEISPRRFESGSHGIPEPILGGEDHHTGRRISGRVIRHLESRRDPCSEIEHHG